MSQGFGEQYKKIEEEKKKKKMQFPLFSQQRNKGQAMMRNGT